VSTRTGQARGRMTSREQGWANWSGSLHGATKCYKNANGI